MRRKALLDQACSFLWQAERAIVRGALKSTIIESWGLQLRYWFQFGNNRSTTNQHFCISHGGGPAQQAIELPHKALLCSIYVKIKQDIYIQEMSGNRHRNLTSISCITTKPSARTRGKKRHQRWPAYHAAPWQVNKFTLRFKGNGLSENFFKFWQHPMMRPDLSHPSGRGLKYWLREGLALLVQAWLFAQQY